MIKPSPIGDEITPETVRHHAQYRVLLFMEPYDDKWWEAELDATADLVYRDDYEKGWTEMFDTISDYMNDPVFDNYEEAMTYLMDDYPFLTKEHIQLWIRNNG